MSPEVWYRYEDFRYAPMLDEFERPVGRGRVELRLREFPVVRYTPCGVWIEAPHTWGSQRFILESARKRYACPTKEEAMASFRARKERQARIYRTGLANVEEALALLERETLVLA